MMHLQSVFHFLCSMKNTGSRNCLLAALMSYSPWWSDRPLAFLLFWSAHMFCLCVSHLVGKHSVCLTTQTVGLCFWCELFTGGEKVWFPCSSPEIPIPCRCVCMSAVQNTKHTQVCRLISNNEGEIIGNKGMKSSVCCYNVPLSLTYLKTFSLIKTHTLS